MSIHSVKRSSSSREVAPMWFLRSLRLTVQKLGNSITKLQKLLTHMGVEGGVWQIRSDLPKLQAYGSSVPNHTGNISSSLFKALTVLEGDAILLSLPRDNTTPTKALNDFQAAQRQAAAKEKDALKKARANTDAHFFDDSQQGSALLDLGGGGGLGGNRQAQTQIQMEQEAELQQLQERETQIRQLESDIMDVNQIFKDLATMVHEQGDMIDSIEANVESAQVHVSQGATQLQQARTYQNKARRKKMCIILILVIVAAVVLGLIIWSAS
ncbi:unnamed protein product, partial [Meganyctiphanes norvegica]